MPAVSFIFPARRLFNSIFIFFFAFLSISYAQTEQQELKNKSTNLGFSVQLYPAGMITTIHSEIFQSHKTSLFLRAGANFANRKDFSLYNDNERGIGFGGSLGYRKHINLNKGRIMAGINTDLWNMWINWKNNIGEPNQTQGRTYTLVLQPWLESGYFIWAKNSLFQVGVTAGFGREINIITTGKDVGQGWIFSLLFQFQYSLKKKN